MMSIRVRIVIAHLRDTHPHKHPLARGIIRQNLGSSITLSTIAPSLTRTDLSSLKFLTFYLFLKVLGVTSHPSSLFSSLDLGEGSPFELDGLSL